MDQHPWIQMTREQLLAAAGITQPTRDTYLYLNLDGQIVDIEKRDRTSYPADELEGIGYVARMMKA